MSDVNWYDCIKSHHKGFGQVWTCSKREKIIEEKKGKKEKKKEKEKKEKDKDKIEKNRKKLKWLTRLFKTSLDANWQNGWSKEV